MRDKPLIYQITNTVSAQLQADCTAVLGGLSIMSRNLEEAAEIAAASDALLINIGTPPENAAKLYHKAAEAAASAGIPIVVDIVGCGFTQLRRRLADGLLSEFKVSVVKGNCSEIAALCGKHTSPRGVSGSAEIFDMKNITTECSEKFGCTVFATGEKDHLAGGGRYDCISGGSQATQRVSGLGCALGSAAALFSASENAYDASLHALSLFRRAAEQASQSACGAFSFRSAFMDILGTLESAKDS